MTITEKREKLYNHCIGRICTKCVLNIPDKWLHPCTTRDCLNFENANENELDEALKMIGETELFDDDNVEHPTHYTSGGIECIDAIKASMSSEEYKGFLKGQVIKYVWRYRLKGKSTEDLKKARFYLDRLITESEASEEC